MTHACPTRRSSDLVSSKNNIDTIYRLIALGGVIEKFAYQVMPKGQKKPWVYKVHISEWRKHFLGRGGGFKKTEDKKNYLPGHDPKELAIQRCAQYGWHTDKIGRASCRERWGQYV